MTKLSILKVYSIVLSLLFVGGIIWSIINGYRYFCEGLQACDQSGQVLEWSEFSKRNFQSLVIAAVGSVFITFMLLKDKRTSEQDMGGWNQVSDDANVIIEDRLLQFDCPNGEYKILLKRTSPSMISVHFNGKEELWPIAKKSIKGSDYKLSGTADWVPEILDEVCWFELDVCSECSITYWGDKVIKRKDTAKT